MDLTEALADCLDKIEYEGLSLSDCLNAFPEYASDLSELLSIAAILRMLAKTVPTPEHSSIRRYEQFCTLLKTLS